MSHPSTDEPVTTPLPPNEFWANYKSFILGTAAFLIIILISFIGYVSHQHTEKTKAEELFEQASTPEKWQEVATQYPKSPQAAQALMRLAADAREKKQWNEAATFYQQLSLSLPKNPFAPAAELAAAECWEAEGKMDKAQQAYLQITQNPQHPFFGAASVGLARLYQAEGNISRAKQTLKEFINQNRPSRFLREAQAMLAQLPEYE